MSPQRQPRHAWLSVAVCTLLWNTVGGQQLRGFLPSKPSQPGASPFPNAGAFNRPQIGPPAGGQRTPAQRGPIQPAQGPGRVQQPGAGMQPRQPARPQLTPGVAQRVPNLGTVQPQQPHQFPGQQQQQQQQQRQQPGGARLQPQPRGPMRQPQPGNPMMQPQNPGARFPGPGAGRQPNRHNFPGAQQATGRIVALQDLVETTGSLQPGQSQRYGFFTNRGGNFSLHIMPCRGVVNWQLMDRQGNIERTVRPIEEDPELFVHMPINRRKRRQLTQPPGGAVGGRAGVGARAGAPGLTGPAAPNGPGGANRAGTANNIFPSMPNPRGNQPPGQGRAGGGFGPPGANAANPFAAAANPQGFPAFPQPGNGYGPNAGGGAFGNQGGGPNSGPGTNNAHEVSGNSLPGPSPFPLPQDFEYEEPEDSDEVGLGTETLPVTDKFEKVDIQGGDYSVLVTNPLREPVIYRILMTRNMGSSPYPTLPEEKQVRVTKVRPNAIEVIWNPVVPQKQGKLQRVQYCVEYSPMPRSRVTDRHSSTCGAHRNRPRATFKAQCTDQTTAMLTALQPATSYFIDVYATNVNERPPRQSAYSSVNATTLAGGVQLPNNRIVSDYMLAPQRGQIFTFSHAAVSGGLPSAVRAMVVPCTGIITWALTRDGWPVDYFEPEFMYDDDDDDSFSDDDNTFNSNMNNMNGNAGNPGGVGGQNNQQFPNNFQNDFGNPNFPGADPFAGPGAGQSGNPFAAAAAAAAAAAGGPNGPGAGGANNPAGPGQAAAPMHNAAFIPPPAANGAAGNRGAPPLQGPGRARGRRQMATFNPVRSLFSMPGGQPDNFQNFQSMQNFQNFQNMQNIQPRSRPVPQPRLGERDAGVGRSTGQSVFEYHNQSTNAVYQLTVFNTGNIDGKFDVFGTTTPNQAPYPEIPSNPQIRVRSSDYRSLSLQWEPSPSANIQYCVVAHPRSQIKGTNLIPSSPCGVMGIESVEQLLKQAKCDRTSRRTVSNLTANTRYEVDVLAVDMQSSQSLSYTSVRAYARPSSGTAVTQSLLTLLLCLAIVLLRQL